MNLLAVRETRNGNLLLSCAVDSEKKPLANAPLFYKSSRVGVVVETIASVDNPFYLAKVDDVKKLVGKSLKAGK